MDAISTLADKLWRGEHRTSDPEHHPFAVLDALEELTPAVGFYKAFSNITAVDTEDGVVLIDTGSFHPLANSRSFQRIREWTSGPIHTAVYTHGHVDHAYGLPPFIEEAKTKGWGRPRIVGHFRIPHRMARYVETAGYNEVINERQFGAPIQWPTNPILPTDTYDDRMTLQVGGKTFELHHAQGETDDHTWVFLPGDRVLCTGDLFIWAAPNAGNPQKVQRYIIEWAAALRKMAAREPEVLLPGHGLPVIGVKRVQEALLNSAAYLESLYRQTVDLMNQGASVDDLIHNVKPPENLAQLPYLQPVYDEPEFIVRNIHRCLGGWYSGAPCELKPPRRADLAREVVRLANGLDKLLHRAAECLDAKDYAMACQFADWAVEAEPLNRAAHSLRAKIYKARAERETSTMAKGVFNAAARESTEKAGEDAQMA